MSFTNGGAGAPLGTGVCFNISDDLDAAQYSTMQSTYQQMLDDQKTAQKELDQCWQDAYAAAVSSAQTTAFFQAAQGVVIAGIQAALAESVSDKQYNIANRQMKISEWEFQRYREDYVKVEKTLSELACDEQPYVPDYVTRPARAVVDVRKQFGQARERLNRSVSRYGLKDAGKALCDLEIAEARAVAQAKDAAYRYEEREADKYYDRRANLLTAVAQVGRNIQASQLTTFQNAVAQANASFQTELNGYNNLLGAVSGGLTGIIQTQFPQPVGFGLVTGAN